LVRAAFDELAPSVKEGSTHLERLDFTDDFIEALIDELIEGDPICDHSVGICACYLIDLIRELKLQINGRETCPLCAGDGFIYRDRHVPECEKYRISGYDCEGEHVLGCWLCEQRGWVYQRGFLLVFEYWRRR